MRQSAGGTRMFRVISFDCFYCINYFAQRSERQESRFAAVVFCEAGLLSNDGATGSEIARGPIAEPAGV